MVNLPYTFVCCCFFSGENFGVSSELPDLAQLKKTITLSQLLVLHVLVFYITITLYQSYLYLHCINVYVHFYQCICTCLDYTGEEETILK